MLFGKSVNWNRRKLWTVNDNSIETENLVKI